MASPKEIFDELGAKYRWDAKFTAWCLAPDGLGAQTIDGFIHAAAAEADIPQLVKAASVDNEIQQVARVRHAWVELSNAKKDGAEIKRKLADTDLDLLLPALELDTCSDRFFARYHVTWPPDLTPSDSLLSRMVKEIQGRPLLSVFAVSKVKSQAQQQRSKKRRTSLSDEISLVHEASDMDDVAPASVTGYLAALFVLMVAYAMAGAARRASAPAREVRGTNSVEVVECPLDVVIRYHHRASQQSAKLPPHRALEWLEDRDMREREVWVDRFRNGSATLGQVIQDVYREREAVWEPPEETPRRSLPPPAAPRREAPQPFGNAQRGDDL